MTLVRPTSIDNVVPALTATIDLLERGQAWTYFDSSLLRNSWAFAGAPGALDNPRYIKDQVGTVYIQGQLTKNSTPSGSPELMLSLPDFLLPVAGAQWVFPIWNSTASSGTALTFIADVSFLGVSIDAWNGAAPFLPYLSLVYKARN